MTTPTTIDGMTTLTTVSHNINISGTPAIISCWKKPHNGNQCREQKTTLQSASCLVDHYIVCALSLGVSLATVLCKFMARIAMASLLMEF